MLDKSILIQVDEITDISLNIEERKTFTTSKNGTLKILLNDGQIKFIGISKEPISKINPASAPGIKISLEPPIEVRYGVLFLSDRQITVYGGESPKMIEQRQRILDPKYAQRANAQRQLVQEQPKAPPNPLPAPQRTPPSTPKKESDSPGFISDSEIDLSTSSSSDVELIEK
ncbi:tudor domain-containing protein 3 [Histomonas meleagridis]|uniref:tudor domain-containing protein 3 n=1 Tax=Histomonas meleagridis TaxID=135588 RepID=UPI00355A7954|nr:tudor domain-containing protein 3 [Histomonas meleagridis]KAH0797491.1 tudor domain-containing protein 3 [Histomonas meleagridis]